MIAKQFDHHRFLKKLHQPLQGMLSIQILGVISYCIYSLLHAYISLYLNFSIFFSDTHLTEAPGTWPAELQCFTSGHCVALLEQFEVN